MRNLLIVLSLTVSLAPAIAYVRDDCYCGISNAEGRRITKGIVTKPFKYPWMVPLFNSHKKAYCGAALISDRHVITAAHCVSFDKSAPDYWANLYGKIKTHHIDQGEIMNFHHINVHPRFKTYGSYDDYDLAILTFRLAIKTFSDKVRPICVPETRQYYGGQKAVITGWGTTDGKVMRMSPFLREGEVQILHPIQCPAATNLNQLYNFRSMMCGFNPNHVDTCQGDSGGVRLVSFNSRFVANFRYFQPLFVKASSNEYEIIAVSSFGEKCGGIYAGVYADISQDLPWVWEVINSTGICPRLT